MLGGALTCGLATSNCRMASTCDFLSTMRQLGRDRFSVTLLSVGLPSKGNLRLYSRVEKQKRRACVVFVATGSGRNSVLGNCRTKYASCVAGPFSIVILYGGMTTIFTGVRLQAPGRSMFRSRILGVSFSRRYTILRKGIVSFAPGRCHALFLFMGGPRVVLAGQRLVRGL